LLLILLISKIIFNLGKKTGEQKGGQPEKGSAQKKEESAVQQTEPADPKQQHTKKKRVERALRSGGDVTAGPSQLPQKPLADVPVVEGGQQEGKAGTSNICSVLLLCILFPQ
jgi:hypothetical protein